MSETLRISRKFSQRAVMEAIVQNGPISRASIAKQTGLSKQTISEIVRQLELDDWVRETGRTSGHIGRTAVTYELIPDAAYIAAVDLGGTKIRVAIADLGCQVFAEEVVPTDPRGGQFVVDQIARLCRQAAQHLKIPSERIRMAVIGAPGAPDATTGRILLAPNIADFDQMNVAAAFEKALGIDVILENDVNLAVIGENWLGQGQGIDNLAFIAVGTGIGGGLMVGGQLVHGATNAAGELGFLPFGADPFDPESLRSGAFERVVASIGIIKRYEALTDQTITVPDIFERAANGDGHAAQVLDETAKYLARGIGAIAAIANPQKVIMGGSIGLRSELIERVRAFLPACFPYPIELEASQLGARAAIIGAAAIGLSHLHNALFGADVPDGRMSLPPAEAVTFREAIG
ncbi:ROK family transcriptional regulator [Rhizobium sp. VS19-DR104.2]|uniref:ROK family transcriptional regulator n=2 Tax=unclassified Rhizobium TaxID=2613769 RepID=UPI001CC73246|nr:MULTISPECIES: ROK family transcriptional regulator [unclassified Rhizobium]MBZ5768234.1 ROK family transcriptional regulator [Rhizobium sp. VS19-DR129.2]MBZ5775894.1 ROK family transcriptional regulator [Rhizobium sp. VS19-DRK62.2]MBZ5820145.1 ROK family transcriptional regulator [Rhizobium sp. VS19-DR183]MBZ5832651.1 ROK family transcriptional regulator [Rhizobium sp. VS19-DR104.2]